MRIGIVCPYSFDAPGGVQWHIRDLAEFLLAHGHAVSVLAPAERTEHLPHYLVSAGYSVPVPYNGSIARVSFGPVAAARVGRWLQQDFDLVHLHEPVTPSISALALWQAEVPVVATFHTAQVRSRALDAVYPALRPSLEKIVARIAVSPAAAANVTRHLGGATVVIPNGVYVDRFALAEPEPAWQGTPQAPTLAFVGRFTEPRKGFAVLAEAMTELVRRRPGVRLLVAGPGDLDATLTELAVPAEVRSAITGLGAVDDAAKARLLRSVDAYIAPNTGGESFGIILVEAMAAGAPVVAADLDAFAAVLTDGSGERVGVLTPVGDAAALADAVDGLLDDPERRHTVSLAATHRAADFDWGTVAAQVVDVYETVLSGAPQEQVTGRGLDLERLSRITRRLGLSRREDRSGPGHDPSDSDGAQV